MVNEILVPILAGVIAIIFILGLILFVSGLADKTNKDEIFGFSSIVFIIAFFMLLIFNSLYYEKSDYIFNHVKENTVKETPEYQHWLIEHNKIKNKK